MKVAIQKFLRRAGLYHRVKSSRAYDLYWRMANPSLITDRQSEVDRLKAEMAKLRADLERLRNIDLQELRAGPKK